MHLVSLHHLVLHLLQQDCWYLCQTLFSRKSNLLCYFEDPKEPERPEAGEAEGSGPGLKVDPKDLEDGADDHAAVELVEG